MHFTRTLSLSLNIQYKFDTFVNGWYIVSIQVKLRKPVSAKCDINKEK